jgi:phosphoglycerol transferase MdoB-like AlkP superfamily enzyme
MVFAGFTVLGIRSGFDVRPLSPGHAFIGRSYNEGNLVLNSSFTLLRSLGRTIIEPYNFFNKTDDYIPFLEDLTLSAIPRKNNNKNIVLIIMESFNLSYMSFPNSYKGYTPFLDELATKSVFFINHYSNAMNSIGASLPLLCGFPSIMPGPPFVSSVFRSNKMQGIGNVLKKNNYETSFFHGGRNGTMAFDIAAGLAGIDNYYGLDEYPTKEHYDGSWGIFDVPFFKFFIEKLSTQKEPFFSTIFSLSSHHPYKIPRKFNGKFPKGSLDIHESIGYADYALRKFFEEASKKSWYNNTLFVITADHTSSTESVAYADILGKFRVPLILFEPSGALKAKVVSHATQHVDVPMTVYSYLGIKPDEVLLFGQDILRDDFQGRALNLLQDEIFLLVHDKQYMTFNPKLNIYNIYDYVSLEPKKTKLIKNNSELQKSMLIEIEAFMQYYTNGLINNNIFYPFPESLILKKQSQDLSTFKKSGL